VQSKKNYCHSEEPSGDEESPKITLVLLLGGFFVTSFLRMARIFWDAYQPAKLEIEAQ